MKTLLLAAACLLVPPSGAFADVTLAKVISDHMVLQRDRSVPVWGMGTPGEKVTVTFGKASASATADAKGHWQVEIATGPANAAPAELVVAGGNTLTIKDVLVGEVWICSGQSNMEYPLNRTFLNGTPPPPAGVRDISTEEYKTAHDPLLRTLKVERKLVNELPTDGWHECGGETLQHFSAIGYFFGKDLRSTLHIPIGLIQTAWAGSRIEPWTPPDAYETSAALKADAAKTRGQLDGSPVGNYYTKIVEPLAPFSVRGVIWYQGESNIITTNDGMRYFDKFEAMVNAWRRDWHNPEMTFLQVQLAPYAYARRNAGNEAKHPETALPELWEAQDAATKLMKHVGMVVINDLADAPTNIHPWNKWDVGHRMALYALGTDYGREGVFTGPTCKSVQFSDGQAIVTFENVGSGLKARDDKPLTGFELAGADGKFEPATATVTDAPSGKTQHVKVTSPGISAPKSLRFAWTELAHPNLVNSADLPTGTFRVPSPADTHKP